MELRTDVSEIGGWTVVNIYGELDVATSPQLREILIRLVSEGSSRLVLDLDRDDPSLEIRVVLDDQRLATIPGTTH